MKYRIAIMGTRGIPNHYGGFEQLAEHLAPGLVEAGHAVTVYNSHNHPYKGEYWNGVRIVHRYDPGMLGSAGQFIYDLGCLLHARRQQYDLILQLGYTSSSVWGRLFPSGAVTIYNMDGLEWKRPKYSKLVRRFLLYAERLAVRYGRYHISDSPVIQSYLREKYGVESEYIAYGATLFESASREIGEDYFLTMARMEPENNIEMILEGFCSSVTSKKMVVIGNMENRFGRGMRERFGNDPRVIFTGAIYDQQRLHGLKYFASLYFHGHSTGGTNPSLLEAMASEALIAAHDNCFNRSVLGRDALFFKDAGHVRMLMESSLVIDGDVWRQHNRQKIIEQYSWADIISHYERFMTGVAMVKEYEKAGEEGGLLHLEHGLGQRE